MLKIKFFNHFIFMIASENNLNDFYCMFFINLFQSLQSHVEIKFINSFLMFVISLFHLWSSYFGNNILNSFYLQSHVENI
jgi:hypothetical protein